MPFIVSWWTDSWSIISPRFPELEGSLWHFHSIFQRDVILSQSASLNPISLRYFLISSFKLFHYLRIGPFISSLSIQILCAFTYTIRLNSTHYSISNQRLESLFSPPASPKAFFLPPFFLYFFLSLFILFLSSFLCFSLHPQYEEAAYYGDMNSLRWKWDLKSLRHWPFNTGWLLYVLPALKLQNSGLFSHSTFVSYDWESKGLLTF